MKKKYSFTAAVIWIVAFQLAGFAIGMTTKNYMYPWYMEINKSSLTPPAVVFSVVWPLLYLMLAIAGYRLYLAAKNKELGLFILQMILNWFWSPVFFVLHKPLWALVILVVIIILNISILRIILNKDKMTSLLLAPYILWLLFACYLNSAIVLLN